MWTLLTSPENQFFSAALVLMLLLGGLELLFFAVGGGLNFLDDMLPDFAEPDAGAVFHLLDWLYVGRLPFMMLLIVALTVFGTLGLALQQMIWVFSGSFVNAWVVTPVVAILSLPMIRLGAAAVYRILPKDESSAIAAHDLIGRVGVITLGKATADKAAEARVQDATGQQHYIMVLADGGRDLPKGTSVLIVAQHGHQYHAIENVNAHLIN